MDCMTSNLTIEWLYIADDFLKLLELYTNQLPFTKVRNSEGYVKQNGNNRGCQDRYVYV